MNTVIAALTAAFKSLFHPRMFTLVIWPMLVSVVAWTGAAFVFWSSWKDILNRLFHAVLPEQWLNGAYAEAISGFVMTFIVLLLLLSMVYLTALLITAVFAMPMMVNHVAQKYYPALERKTGGGTTKGALVNTLVAIALYCIALVISLPLWLIFPLSVVMPVILAAWLNQRLFRYDALAEHAEPAEIAQVARRARSKLYGLGVAAGLLQFVPVLNLLLPVYMGLAFSHLCLGELARLRQPA